MTKHNDINNWFVVALHGDGKAPVIVAAEQADNKARSIAESYAKKNPGIAVSLYKREAVVIGTTTTKWE